MVTQSKARSPVAVPPGNLRQLIKELMLDSIIHPEDLEPNITENIRLCQENLKYDYWVRPFRKKE